MEHGRGQTDPALQALLRVLDKLPEPALRALDEPPRGGMTAGSASPGSSGNLRYADHVFGILTFADWESYGKAMQALTTDAEYQRIYGELTEAFELQERFVSAVEDL